MPGDQPDERPFGRWAADDLRRAFVAGAVWQMWTRGYTPFSSERNEMEAEAERRYPGGALAKEETR